MASRAAPAVPEHEDRAMADARQPAPVPKANLLAFIEQFRSTHDLVEMDAPGFTAALRDPDPGPDVRL